MTALTPPVATATTNISIDAGNPKSSAPQSDKHHATSITSKGETATSQMSSDREPKKRPGSRIPPSPLRFSTAFESLLSPRPTASTFPPLLSPRPSGQTNNGISDEGLDTWFDEFRQFDTTLQQMAKASEDVKFKEELNTIERWFEVLSEAEKTATVYTLLQHSNQVQVRFLTAVLQQMTGTEPKFAPGTPNKDTTKSGIPLASILRSPLPPTPTKPVIILNDDTEPDDKKPLHPLSPNHRDNTESDQGKENGEEDEGQVIEVKLPPNSLSAAPSGPLDWASMVPTPHGLIFQKNPNLGIPSPSPRTASGASAFSGTPGLYSPYSPSGPGGHGMLAYMQGQGLGFGLNGVGYLNGINMGMMGGMAGGLGLGAMPMMMNGMGGLGGNLVGQPFPLLHQWGQQSPGNKKSNVAPKNGPNATTKGAAKSSTNWRSRGTTPTSATSSLYQAKSPTVDESSGVKREDDFNPKVLEDIPRWLKSLRLHKYTSCFDGLKWQEMVLLDEEALEKRGVAALGARRRMVKTFGVVRKAMGLEPADQDEPRQDRVEGATKTRVDRRCASDSRAKD
ncbi:hypothetical protein AX16_010714 [Volvariella volvacea WC 439]|nr:hypothetical protein AX16_010714 [Volvariella volvacea WC 439]